MYRLLDNGLWNLVLVPVAVLLILFGIRTLRSDKTSGFGLKLALVLNTSLAIVLGWAGCATAKDKGEEELVACYIVPYMPDENVPAEFQESGGWYDLERAVVDLENEITSGEFDPDTYDELRNRITEAENKLSGDGTLDDAELDIITAYCSERLAWYLHMVGGATCYKPMPAPTGREAVKKDAVTRAMELRDFYANYQISGDAYDTALAALEEDLREYTGDEDVSTLRQLILDLADGVKYD
ncbi:MAG: hypothetical protein JSW52_00675 [Candidatus Coatesbacteria bacterium]|nr:MAG: hypothetical protein JSW52_00675 [Candidatus Coatesbacteria bacterium]